ncbi:hypothetical protein LG200_12780 [Methylobacillus caricis]|uniref:hypothetical protein n=1 Tax=Methylobacillus caricis TaxID=1971611 RepID=UPI001CFFCAD1|nr:hypothetical protein [Methylobacillus caricis]MCB5188878.1 hypothetical protein [Methylobacillus caricis]
MSDIETRIKSELEDFWDERAIPLGPGGITSVDDLVDGIESMTAVDVLATLDRLLDKKVPNTVIQPGGYRTKEEFIDKLTTKVVEWMAGK